MLNGVWPALIALVLLSGLAALAPARRLYAGGWSERAVGTYFLALWVGAVAVVVAPGALRFLVPILVVAWLAPFVTLRVAR